MPQDPSLYGQPPPKRQKKQMALSSSLDFTSQLTSLISNPSSTTTARPRPSKSKSDLFSTVKTKRRPGAKQPNQDNQDDGRPNKSNRLTLRNPNTTEDEKATFDRARRKMEEKARLYAAMKRGDYVAQEGESAPLVDFDRKWAEAQAKGIDLDEDGDTSASDNNDSDAAPEEMVEYEDEFGRLRTATKSAYLLHQRRQARGLAAATELQEMSARPAAPENIIYGETIQAEAFFTAGDPDKMEELARKRDRSVTPPEARHYDATEEIRNRGTGFYAFSKDEEDRRRAMENLAKEREETERVRREREDAKEKRRREIEERRKAVLERRRGKDEEKAKAMADSFLAGFEPELLAKREERERSAASGGTEKDGAATSEEDLK